MSFEINIVSIEQKNTTHFGQDLSILVQNEIEHKDEGVARYYKIWPQMCKTEGIWYTLGRIHRGFFSAIPICESDFHISPKVLPIPNWITDPDVIESLTPISIKEEYINDFKTIVECLINESPQKKILFLARYQCPDEEVMIEPITLDEFYSRLENKNILFNACYTIIGGTTKG